MACCLNIKPYGTEFDLNLIKVSFVFTHFPHTATLKILSVFSVRGKFNFVAGFLIKHINTGLFKTIVWFLTTCHTQYTSDRSICIFLFNRTTFQVFVTYLTGALYLHPLWLYKYQHENRVRSKLSVACQLFAFRCHLSKLRSKRRNA